MNPKDIPNYAVDVAARWTLEAIRRWIEENGGEKNADVQVLRSAGADCGGRI